MQPFEITHVMFFSSTLYYHPDVCPSFSSDHYCYIICLLWVTEGVGVEVWSLLNRVNDVHRCQHSNINIVSHSIPSFLM